jgi:L-ascorbate metabolism protein UlaG (beta-lactamase superfamily)
MKIKWLGHSSFLITTDAGTRIITDPYAPSDKLNYGEIKESADIVTKSHDHFDHGNVAAVMGNPEVVGESGSVETKGIQFHGIPTHHDESGGGQRGNNIIFCFEVDGIRVCHLGDLGHQLGDKEVAELGKVDILLAPVGGFYTIDAKVATEVSAKLVPKVIIPMHYKNDRCDLPISGVDDFLQGKTGVSRANASEVQFKAGELPVTMQIIVLKSKL